MRKVLLLVEGQTEETFVKRVINPYLSSKEIYIEPKIITTKRVKRGPDFKGGVPHYGRVKTQILRLLNDTSAHIVSTMIDYYGLPNDFPGKVNQSGRNAIERVDHLEKQLGKDIDHRKFYPYYSLHEFEALLYCSPRTIAETMINLKAEPELIAIRNAFTSPEEINDNPETAPSKRLKRIFPIYQKPLYGSLISTRIGLDTIRSECPHFNAWLTYIEAP
jgi:hypothetical protein